MSKQLMEVTPEGQLSPVDLIRLRNRKFQEGNGIKTPLAAVPDSELISCLVSLGQPLWSAVELRKNPQLRLAALRLWVDVGDAGKGDPAARERVDYIRQCFSQMRKEEILADDPARVTGDAFDPKVLL